MNRLDIEGGDAMSLTYEEVLALFQETDRQMQETDRRMQETDRQMQETNKKLEKGFQELRQQIGRLGNRLGEFVEEMVKPAAVRLFQARGIPVHRVIREVTAYDDDGNFVFEIDLLVINNDAAVAVECKSHAGIEDIKEHMERLAIFKRYYPEYAKFKLYGAIAAMVMPDEVARFAYRHGLWVLAQSGDHILIKNDGKFTPKEW
ncbi:MAG: DUF3782 domain-containing protein [Dissulfuribacterales bacterium]